MAGREVFKAAVLSMADACDQALRRAELTADDIDLLIPHQANIRIIEATAKHAGVPMEKVYVNVDRFGNTSAASIAIALDEAVKTGRLTAGVTGMFCAFGAGFTWAGMGVRGERGGGAGGARPGGGGGKTGVGRGPAGRIAPRAGG